MRTLIQQFKTVTPTLLIAWLLTLLSLLIAIFASTVKDFSLDTLTKDPTALMNAPFYFGFFSNLGIIIWSASFIICWFAAYRIKDHIHLKNDFFFLVISGMITFLMTIDDLYQLHEIVFPYYFDIPENAVYLTYMNIYLLYFIRFRKTLLQSDFIILVLAFFFLGLSTVIDLLPLPIPKDTFLEDAFKLVGAVTWLVYFFRTGNEVLDKAA
jgi:hypothetical protein